MSKRNFIVWHSMKNEYGNGSWALIDGLVTVRTADGSKTTQLGWMPPDFLASVLMREISRETARGHTD
jgi:hypothetical protein